MLRLHAARLALAAACLVAATAAALAQDTRPRARDLVMPRGPYLGLGAGIGFAEDNDIRFGDVDSKTKYDIGPTGTVSLGYGFDFGLRLELEGGYRLFGVDEVGGAGGDGRLQIGSAMVNAIYDVPLPTFGIPLLPHVGVGVGYAHLWNRSLPHGPAGLTVKGQDDTIAFQGIAGLDYVITPNLVAGIDYKYFLAHDVDFKLAGTGTTAHVGDVGAHTVMASLRWYWGAPEPRRAPEPAAAVAPPPPPAVPPAIARTYNVYFDFDRAELTPEAQQIVAEAATNAQRGGVSRILVTGHADRAGSDAYNQGLSERRAAAVRQELQRRGVGPAEIATTAQGERSPAVPTPDGVREPRNRRVEIVLQTPGA
jgi:OOP family OmpA-OmpF porin